MSFTRYPKYKPSGVEWLGEVPEHWNPIRLRFLLREGYEGIKIGPFGSQLKSDMLDYTGFYKVYGQENIIANDFSCGDRYINEDKFTELLVYEIVPGDLLITMMGTSGRCDVVPMNSIRGIMDSHLLRMRVVSSVHVDFVRLLIDEAAYLTTQIQLAGKGSIMQGLNSSIVKDLLLLVPSLEDQYQILNFLGQETAKIDALVAEQKKLIELLKEKRQAVISHAVTKGLNPDAPMKDFGIEWLGDVPEHWEIKPLFGAMVERNEQNKGMVENNLLSLSYGVIIPKDITSNDGLLPESFETYQIVRPGDIVFRLTDLQNDKRSLRSAIVKDTGIITSAYLAVTPQHDNPIFMSYLFRAYDTTKVFYSMGGGLRQSLKFSDMKRLPTLFPPLSEQKDISAFLDQETAKIDALVAEAQHAIDLLQERRTSLISAAVIGQIDVSNIAAKDNS